MEIFVLLYLFIKEEHMYWHLSNSQKIIINVWLRIGIIGLKVLELNIYDNFIGRQKNWLDTLLRMISINEGTKSSSFGIYLYIVD